MTHKHASAETSYGRGPALRKRVHYAPDFIGPREEPTSEGLPLLERRAEDLAHIAVTNVVKFRREYDRFEHDTELAIRDYVLSVHEDFPEEMTVEGQASRYADKLFSNAIQEVTVEDVQQQVVHEAIAGAQHATHENIAKTKAFEALQAEYAGAQVTLIELRLNMLSRGASDEDLAAFDRIAARHLPFPVEVENIHEPESITDKFKAIIANLSRRAIHIFSAEQAAIR